MNTVKGSIVKAVAGREKNGFLLFSTAIPFLLTLQTESEERLRSLKEKAYSYFSYRNRDRGFNQDQSADKKNFEQF